MVVNIVELSSRAAACVLRHRPDNIKVPPYQGRCLALNSLVQVSRYEWGEVVIEFVQGHGCGTIFLAVALYLYGWEKRRAG